MKKITFIISLLFVANISAQVINEGFDDITTLTGWNQVNASVPVGTTNWFQGAPATFPAFDGATNSYIGANFNSTTGANTINNFLITPVVSLSDGDVVSFYTRVPVSNFPDRLEVRLSTLGAGSTDPAGATSVGSYTTLLLEVNPTLTNGGYPTAWTQYTATISGIGNNVSSRVAFRYWVTNGGPLGANSNFIGIDRVVIGTPPTCDVPSAFVENDITDSSADIGWTDNNGAGTTFDIEWGLEGFTLGTGTQVNGLTSTNYVFPGLLADTQYSFYITANCTGGDGSSVQVGPVDFLTAFDCSTITLPYDETFDNNNRFLSCYTTEDVDADSISWISQQDLDLDGDTVPETFATNGNSTTAKDDWLFSPGYSLTAGVEYEVTSIFNTFGTGASGSLEALITSSASSTATTQIPLFSQTGIVPQGAFETLETNAYVQTNTFTPTTSGTYHIAYHSFGPGNSGFILLFDSNMSSTLSVDEFNNNTFKHFYNKDTDVLTMTSSDLAFDAIEMYNLLGQQVLNTSLSQTRETVNMASLEDGVYLAKVSIQGRTQTVKILKN